MNDKHSMDETQTWAHIRHCYEELRNRNKLDTDKDDLQEDENNANILPILPSHLSYQPFGGYRSFYSFEDFNQIPPVSQTLVLHYKSTEIIGRCNSTGRVAFFDFINPPNPTEIEKISFFVDILKNTKKSRSPRFMWQDAWGSVWGFRCIRYERRVSWSKETLIPGGNQLCNTLSSILEVDIWCYIRLSVKHFDWTNCQALCSHTHSENNNKLCHIRSTSPPLLNALCVDAKVMLVVNYLADLGLINRAVGIVRDTWYQHPQGPNQTRQQDHHPETYVVLEFLKYLATKSFIPNKFPKLVPIPVYTQTCDKMRKCCFIQAILLRVCTALTAHKSQGMTIGVGELFIKVVAYLYEEAGTAGLEP